MPVMLVLTMTLLFPGHANSTVTHSMQVPSPGICRKVGHVLAENTEERRIEFVCQLRS